MKKVFCLSAIAFSFAFQGSVFAQQQDTPITEEDYNVVMSSVCEASNTDTPGDILSAVVSNIRGSVESEKLTKLQELALEVFLMPSIEKERLCNQGELAS